MFSSNKYVITIILLQRRNSGMGYFLHFHMEEQLSKLFELSNSCGIGTSFPSQLHACQSFPSRLPTFVPNISPASNGAVNSWQKLLIFFWQADRFNVICEREKSNQFQPLLCIQIFMKSEQQKFINSNPLFGQDIQEILSGLPTALICLARFCVIE